jgi:hypothetical protein
MASIWSKVSRIVFGAGREDVHRPYFEARHIDTLDFVAKAPIGRMWSLKAASFVRNAWRLLPARGPGAA